EALFDKSQVLVERAGEIGQLTIVGGRQRQHRGRGSGTFQRLGVISRCSATVGAQNNRKSVTAKPFSRGSVSHLPWINYPQARDQQFTRKGSIVRHAGCWGMPG